LADLIGLRTAAEANEWTDPHATKQNEGGVNGQGASECASQSAREIERQGKGQTAGDLEAGL
jgi:hypothetical protein